MKINNITELKIGMKVRLRYREVYPHHGRIYTPDQYIGTVKEIQKNRLPLIGVINLLGEFREWPYIDLDIL